MQLSLKLNRVDIIERILLEVDAKWFPNAGAVSNAVCKLIQSGMYSIAFRVCDRLKGTYSDYETTNTLFRLMLEDAPQNEQRLYELVSKRSQSLKVELVYDFGTYLAHNHSPLAIEVFDKAFEFIKEHLGQAHLSYSEERITEHLIQHNQYVEALRITSL
ncbi:hypothetical protein HC928_21245, partial [bacterium]|nr:hypothetical protein [bacterium]